MSATKNAAQWRFNAGVKFDILPEWFSVTSYSVTDLDNTDTDTDADTDADVIYPPTPEIFRRRCSCRRSGSGWVHQASPEKKKEKEEETVKTIISVSSSSSQSANSSGLSSFMAICSYLPDVSTINERLQDICIFGNSRSITGFGTKSWSIVLFLNALMHWNHNRCMFI